MNGGTHMLIGLTTGAAVAAYFHVPPFLPVVTLLAVSVLGSVLPDIDHPASFISRRVGLLGWPFRLFSHRGFTHSILATLILAFALTYIEAPAPLGMALLLGYLSHLLADSMTRAGIRLLWPWRIRVGLPRPLAVGSQIEGLIGILAMILSTWLLNHL